MRAVWGGTDDVGEAEWIHIAVSSRREGCASPLILSPSQQHTGLPNRGVLAHSEENWNSAALWFGSHRIDVVILKLQDVDFLICLVFSGDSLN